MDFTAAEEQFLISTPVNSFFIISRIFKVIQNIFIENIKSYQPIYKTKGPSGSHVTSSMKLFVTIVKYDPKELHLRY